MAGTAQQHVDEWADAVLGAESLRPVRRGDNLQSGSTWGNQSPRKPSATERLAADRMTRFERLGHQVLAWTLAPILVALVVALVKKVI